MKKILLLGGMLGLGLALCSCGQKTEDVLKKSISLAGTKWKLIGFVDTKTGNMNEADSISQSVKNASSLLKSFQPKMKEVDEWKNSAKRKEIMDNTEALGLANGGIVVYSSPVGHHIYTIDPIFPCAAIPQEFMVSDMQVLISGDILCETIYGSQGCLDCPTPISYV
jgi:hypothetical protein